MACADSEYVRSTQMASARVACTCSRNDHNLDSMPLCNELDARYRVPVEIIPRYLGAAVWICVVEQPDPFVPTVGAAGSRTVWDRSPIDNARRI
jgi:hypothetical protein